MLTQTYTGLWSKYRPAILKMMINAEEQPQVYHLSEHEFHAFNNSKRGAYTFKLQIQNGKAVSGLKDSIVAQSLWEILQQSPKATELVSNSDFHFSMNREFILQVEKKND